MNLVCARPFVNISPLFMSFFNFFIRKPLLEPQFSWLFPKFLLNFFLMKRNAYIFKVRFHVDNKSTPAFAHILF